jgi:hypothetical protein
MEKVSIGKRGVDINYKGSQGHTERTVVLWEGEEVPLLSRECFLYI